MLKYNKTIKTRKTTNVATTINQKMSRVKHFFEMNSITIPKPNWLDWKNRNTGHKKPITKKKTFKPDELRRVLQNAIHYILHYF